MDTYTTSQKGGYTFYFCQFSFIVMIIYIDMWYCVPNKKKCDIN